MNLVLTSDFPSLPNEAVCAAMRAASANPRIAWIAHASPERAAYFERATRAFGELGFRRLDCVSGDPAVPARPTRLDDYDVVFLSGGDPITLRSELLRSGLFSALADRIRDGRCLVAASGGAMQLTPNLSLFRLASIPEERVIADRERFRAMGAAPFELLPHLNRHADDFLDKVARYSAHTDCDILALADGSAWLCDDGGVRIVGEALCFRDGEREAVAS